MSQFGIQCWTVICELAPWLLLGMLLSGLMHACMPTDFVRQKFRGFSGVLKAVGLGVPLPLCSCGVIPAGIGLKNQGASNGAAIGFLISTPQTGVDSILVSAAFFGWPFAIFKMVSAAVLGVVGGWMADLVDPELDESKQSVNKKSPAETDVDVDAKAKSGLGSLPILTSIPAAPNPQSPAAGPRKPIWLVWLADTLSHSIGILRSIWIWLLVGVLLSSVIETLIPKQWLELVAGTGLWMSMVLVLLISIPLYVCATASVPIAASIVHGGFPPAAALVFLIAGPATNVSTIGAIYSRFGLRILLVYLSTIVLGSCLFAVLFDWVLTAKMGEVKSHHHQHGNAWWQIASAILILSLMAYFAIQSVRSRLKGSV